MTQDELKTIVHYDPNTGIFTNLKKRSRVPVGKVIGTMGNFYLQCVINRKCYQLHRLAWFYMYGFFPKGEIDHINGVKTDNRISNLRDVSPSENQLNKWNAQSNNSSGLLGVCVNKKDKKFTSYISFKKCRKYLGYFNTAEEAHKAYMEAKNELYKNSMETSGK